MNASDFSELRPGDKVKFLPERCGRTYDRIKWIVNTLKVNPDGILTIKAIRWNNFQADNGFYYWYHRNWVTKVNSILFTDEDFKL